MATANPVVATDKTITMPAEKAALVGELLKQMSITPKSMGAGATPGTVTIVAEMDDAQVKTLNEVIAKIERRETVANVLHKTGELAVKTVDFLGNDVARPAVGVGLQVGAGMLGTVVKFGTETGAKLVNEIAEAGVKTVNDVRVSDDAQKFKQSLSTIGSCFGLFSGNNESKKIKIA